MGRGILGKVLNSWEDHELDDSIYVPAGIEPSLDTEVSVLPFDRTRRRVFEGQQYLLGMEQVRDAIEGLERQIGRLATPRERLRAMLYFAAHDAFIGPDSAVDV